MSVVITTIVIGIMLAAYLKMVAVQNQFTMRSQGWNRSVPVLEAGVEEAIAHLNKNASADSGGTFSLNLATDGWTAQDQGGWYKSGWVGDDYYYTTISEFTPGATGAGTYPSIQSTGFVSQLPNWSFHRSAGPFFLAAVNLSPTYSSRAVLAGTTNVPTFTKALVAKRGITMSGQNVRTDSFDSGIPAYNDGFGHYTNTPGKWKCNGDIASNDTITNTLAIGNANIFGRVATGPYGTVKLGSAGMVGDVAWQNDLLNAGKIKPGWSTDDMNMDFPSVVVPPSLYGAVPPSGSSFTTNGVTYTMVLENGDYKIPNGQDLNGKVLVLGTVRLLVAGDSKIALSGGQDRLTLAPGAKIKVYADCVTASIGGNGVQNDGIASQFYYFGTDRNTSLSYGGNAAFTGVFYAPNADMSMGGGGNATIDFSGSAIAKTIKLTGNFTFHYDENLKRTGLYRGYILTSWDEK